MASRTQRAWVWASSRRWGRTGKPRVQQSMGSTESNMTEQLNNSNVTWNKWIIFISKEVPTINRKPFHILFDFYTYLLILNFELNYLQKSLIIYLMPYQSSTFSFGLFTYIHEIRMFTKMVNAFTFWEMGNKSPIINF